MLGCLRPRTEESIKSKEIDKEIMAITKHFTNAIKILLLGTGESGKTTIIKQMKILHIKNGFTDRERLDYVNEIKNNIHESIYELCKYVKILGLEFDSSDNNNLANYILKIERFNSTSVSDEYYQIVKALWADTGVRECFRRSNEFQLIDSAKYFLDAIDVVCQSKYTPTDHDILQCRKITTGIHEIIFSVKIPKSMGGGIQEFRMFDVGGQRDQRNKWMQVFEGIQAVLFLISCGDFDQTLREDHKQNRLVESIRLFSGVWHNRFLIDSGIIVFLNKQDVMEAKIRAGKNIGKYFSEYDHYRLSPHEGNVFDECNKTRCFIRSKLIDITQEPPRRISQLQNFDVPRECYYHFTVATDTNNVKRVFEDVYNMILTKNLTDIGLI